MDKKRALDILRSHYPDVRFVKGFISRQRIRRVVRELLPEKEVTAAESEERTKQFMVNKCRQRWPKAYKREEKKMISLLSRAPAFAGREDDRCLRTDILFCFFAYGFQPDEYLFFELEGKTPDERRALLSDLERFQIIYRLNDISEIQVFNNKKRTVDVFGKYYARDTIYVSRKKDYQRFCDFVARHPVFVQKPVYEAMGRGIELVNAEEANITTKELFQKVIASGPNLLEERVVQSEDICALNASSVNTVRCITLNTHDGIVVFSCFMKIGRAGSFVDNGGAGGILVGIDKETGVLDTDGYDELNIRYEIHPDTKIAFKGYPLPEWQQMLDICVEMSAKMPRVRIIGWDMAHTDNGWVVIEGNGRTQLIGPQIVWKMGGYSKTLCISICRIWIRLSDDCASSLCTLIACASKECCLR